MSKSSVKSSVRLDEKLNVDYDKLSEETGRTKTELINTALKFYLDSYYCKNKATFLNENILSSMQGMVDGLEHRLNNKTNQLLSELAIQEGIVAQLLAYSLDADGDTVAEYRKKAVEFLKVNQRILRLDKLME
jgi:hypothetical protein